MAPAYPVTACRRLGRRFFPGRRPVDASAVLALLVEEPGALDLRSVGRERRVHGDLSEVIQKSMQHDVDTEGLEYDLQALGVELYPFDLVHARVTAELWELAPTAGLSLGDRACLSLAAGLGAMAARPIDLGPRSTSASRCERCADCSEARDTEIDIPRSRSCSPPLGQTGREE
jgi:ribonuclease VapC